MIEESLGFHVSVTLEEISKLCFGRNGVACKHSIRQNVPFLSKHDNFSSFIDTYIFMTRSSSLDRSFLLRKEASSFLTLIWFKKIVSHDDCTKS